MYHSVLLRTSLNFHVSLLSLNMLGLFRRSFTRRFSNERIAELEKQVADLTEKLKTSQKPSGIMGMIKEKGIPFAVWYFCVWAGGFAGIYGLLEVDIISYPGVVKFAKSLGADKLYNLDSIDPKNGKLAVAFLANEIADPIRLPLVLISLNPAIRAFKRFKS